MSAAIRCGGKITHRGYRQISAISQSGWSSSDPWLGFFYGAVDAEPVRGAAVCADQAAFLVPEPHDLTSVDVVVVSYNSHVHLRGCVEPLAAASQDNVIVVDNASADDSPKAVEGLPVTVIAQDFNGGFAQGCNRGWRVGTAPYVLFLNPDARIEPAAVESLGRVLEGDSHVGIVGPGS